MTRAKTDCFAYKPGRQNPRRKAECAALDKLYCRDGECSFYKEQQSVAGYPKDEYRDTQNMSTGQQNEAGYPESEYGNTRNMSIKQQNEAEYPKYEYSDTYNASTAAALIRAQGEQIRRMSAEEYLKDKSRETEVFCRKYRQKQEEKEYTRSN